MCLYIKQLDSCLWSIAMLLTAVCVYVHVFACNECVGVCVLVCGRGSYSAALLTGACLAVTLPLAETEMDSHAAVEGQG